MNCSHCGQPNEAGSLFCQNCGSRMEPVAPPPPEPAQTQPLWSPPVQPPPSAPAYSAETGPTRRTREKRGKGGKGGAVTIILGALCALLAVVVVLMAFGVTDAVFSPQQKTFKTPEDAIEYFISHVKSGDYEGAMAACAVDEIAESYDYEAMVERLRAMPPSMPYLPAEYELYAAYNESSLKTQIMRQLAYMAMSVSLPNEYSDFLNGRSLYGESIDYGHVVKDMDPESFLAIEIVEIGQNERTEDDSYLDSMEKQAEIYGADEMTAYDVLYDIGGDYYAGGVTLLEYEGGWLILSLNDPFLDQPVTGVLIPLDSKSDFDDLLSGNYTATAETQPSETDTVSEAPTAEVTMEAPVESYTVGVSLPSMTASWYAMMAEDITAALSAYGHEVIYTDANFDVTAQVSQVENLIAMGIDVLVIDPLDFNTCNLALMKANEAGVAVILLGNDGVEELAGLYISAIGYDYYDSAFILAGWMEANLGSDIRIGEITGIPDIDVTQQFSAGFSAVLDNNSGWTLVVSQSTNFSTDEAQVAAENMLTAYPDLNVLFCHMDSMAIGAAQAVEEMGLTGQVLVVSIGNQAVTLEAIQSGKISAVSTLSPYVGATVADVVDDVMAGQSVDAWIVMPSFIIDETNIDSMWSMGY